MNETQNAANLKGTNVQVAVRCRPVNAEERKSGQPSVVTCDSENKNIKISYGPTGKKQIKNFTFDKVFGMYSRQEEVFDSMVRPIVEECLEGFNCTIFAYGQTGTGKTHTMEGNIHSDEDAGIVPRSVKAILENLEGSGSEFTIRVSFLELYNEELQDLLNISGDKKLKLCEDVKRGVVCQNLEEITVLNVPDIFTILQRGIQQRQTAATLCNKNSSRSHSIFTMKIMIKECNVEGEEVIRHGQLNLVDLAGSECIGRSGAKNDRAREAGSINQSLLTLGRVITALVDHHGHIPYRDSKLTRLLQESLGGKAKTCIIATLSPSQSAVEETMSTLDYAYRAKSIKNQPTVNQRLTKKTIMKEYLAEVETLKMQLMQSREKNGVYMAAEEFYAMETRLAAQESQLEECESALTQRNDEIKLVRRERDEYFAGYESTKQQLGVVAAELDDARVTLDEAKETVTGAYVELSSTEAVVSEQLQTESKLLQQGQCLQKDLSHAQSDVNRLLDKVQRAAQSEEQKLRETQQFVSQLCASSQQLASQVQGLSQRSSEHAGTLNSGVSQMLQQGRTTCSSLKSAISAALTTMIGDAEAARDDMTASCSGLKTHLHSTNTHLESTLRSLQGQLSEWLGEVDVSMRQAQEQLAAQDKQIAVASATISQHCAQLSQLSASFLAQQQSLRDASLAQSAQLQSELKAQFESYNQQAQEKSSEATIMLRSQATAMENAMKTMLAELVNKGAAAFEASAARTTAFSSAAAQRLDQGILAFNSAQSGIHNGAVEHSAEVKALLSQSSQQFTTDMSVVSLQRETADNTLSTVSGMVGAKRKYLDVTVTELCAHVDAAIEQGVTVVDATSATANKVLSDVSSASQAMNATASGAMDTFTTFMDQEGEALRSGLQDHFTTVSAHAQVQSNDLVALKKAAGIHSETMEGHRLPSSGRTPQKVAPVSFEGPFKRTRSHGIIRSEAKAQIQQTEDGEPISYELARAGIIDCIALSASIPMEAEIEVEAPFVAAIETQEHVVSDRSSTGSTGSAASSSTISSKESSSGKYSADGDLEVDGEGGFLLGPSENVNPNITTTRQSRGNAKGRSKLAAPGSSRSSRSALAAAMDSDA